MSSALLSPDKAPSLTDADTKLAPSNMNAKIRLEHISKTFTSREGNAAVLSDVSLTINPGEFVCLVGPSGCGKSTLLNIIAGLLKQDAGSARMDGSDIIGAGPERAVIFQEAGLFPWLTAVQNVDFALNRVKNKKQRRELARQHLQTVQLSRFSDLYPHELSGGMKQRVAIARALALEPDVLLMDEPFAALDAQTRNLLIDEIQRIWLETKKTVVFVTHNVMEAVTLADRVICMGARPGCIKEELLIDLPRPRVLESPETARFAQIIMKSLQDEILKTVQEESDHAETDRTRGNKSSPHRLVRLFDRSVGDRFQA